MAHSSPVGCLAYRLSHGDCSMETLAAPVAYWPTAVNISRFVFSVCLCVTCDRVFVCVLYSNLSKRHVLSV